MKRNKRARALAAKRAWKAARVGHAEGTSRYARKYKYLHVHGLWGFEVPEPKPWR